MLDSELHWYTTSWTGRVGAHRTDHVSRGYDGAEWLAIGRGRGPIGGALMLATDRRYVALRALMTAAALLRLKCTGPWKMAICSSRLHRPFLL